MILQRVSAAKWEEAERYWVDKFREQGCNILNAQDGGDYSANKKERKPEESLNPIVPKPVAAVFILRLKKESGVQAKSLSWPCLGG